MLVLSRRISETLKIGEHITITILGIKGGQVRIGIAAPVEIPIRRQEGFHRMKEREPVLEYEEKSV